MKTPSPKPESKEIDTYVFDARDLLPASDYFEKLDLSTWLPPTKPKIK